MPFVESVLSTVFVNMEARASKCQRGFKGAFIAMESL